MTKHPSFTQISIMNTLDGQLFVALLSSGDSGRLEGTVPLELTPLKHWSLVPSAEEDFKSPKCHCLGKIGKSFISIQTKDMNKMKLTFTFMDPGSLRQTAKIPQQIWGK